jgi:cytochrome P450
MSVASPGNTVLDLTDPTTFVTNDPHDFWRGVRETDRVLWSEGQAGRPGFWAVACHEDVVCAYANAAELKSARGTVLDVLLHGDDAGGGKMLAVTDRPRHRQLRSVMMRALSARILDELEGKLQQSVQRLIGEMTERDEFDFATDVAEHIPINTICDLLSIPVADRAALLRLNKLALSSDSADIDELASLEARNEIVLYFVDLAQERRSNPGGDVVSAIAGARIDGEPLTLDEIALNCYSLILGGDESSRLSAISGVKALAEHPAQWRALQAGEVVLETAVEEIVRWATPAMYFARTASADLSIAGKRIRAGDIVTLWNISANNDETAFTAPRALDLSRSPNRHVAFGYGPHFCIGAFLGRAELRALLTALVQRVADLELRGTPARVFSSFVYGYSSLPVAFRSR